MLENCKFSCKHNVENCADHRDECDSWKNMGECDKNPNYMIAMCATSCGKCSDSVKKTGMP